MYMESLSLGLTSEEAKVKLVKYGSNILPDKPPPSLLSIFFSQFKNPLVYILLAAGIVTLFLGDFSDSAIIFFVVLVNSLLGFIQEKKANSALASLRSLVRPSAKVIRDGKKIRVDSNKIVPGDIVELELGDKIPADGKLLQANRFFVEEAILTGESLPVGKEKDGEVYMGTIVSTGEALMEVVVTGAKTQMGKIAVSIQKPDEDTPLTKQLKKFSGQLTLLVIVLTLFVFLVGLLTGKDLVEIFKTSVALAVSSIPEGLLIALTVVLAVGMQRILKMKGLVRNLVSAETLGGVTTLCVDKTGTLTEGKPLVTDVISTQEQDLTAQNLLQLSASLEQGSEHALAEAIVGSAKKKNITLMKTSDFKAIPGHGIEGKVGDKKYILGNRALMRKDKVGYENFEDQIMDLEQEGKTVMLLAEGDKLLGLIAVADVLKPKVRELVQELERKKILVWMITGDNERTAKAVAKKAGINNILAEVLPQEKSEKVRQFKSEHGGVVAFVGDGINDAPALASADVGIAMGTGTDVAMEASGITLLSKDIFSVAMALDLSRRTLSIIKQNLFWAFGYNIILIPVAAGILYPFFGWLLNPALAAFAMAASSISVVGNSLRLKSIA